MIRVGDKVRSIYHPDKGTAVARDPELQAFLVELEGENLELRAWRGGDTWRGVYSTDPSKYYMWYFSVDLELIKPGNQRIPKKYI